jgi:hypothetical protein
MGSWVALIDKICCRGRGDFDLRFERFKAAPLSSLGTEERNHASGDSARPGMTPLA